MLFHRIRGWFLVLGLIAGGAGGAGCVGESPCEYTATCPPPEAGFEDTNASDPVGTASDTDESATEEPTESTDSEPTETEDDEPKPIPTITFPPVLPVTPESPVDAGPEDEDLDADVSDPEADAQVVDPETTEPEGIDTESTEPEGIETEPTEPETSEPEQTEPEITEPEVIPDYCEENNGGCDPLTACTTTPVRAECGVCPAGYLGSGAVGCAPGLLGLGLSHGSSSPAIDPNVDTYQVVVPVFIQNLTLSASAPAGATLSIRGALVAPGTTWTSPPLDLGLNTISILVEQPGHPSSTYTLNVTRGADATVYFKASNAGTGDRFGAAVALSSDGSTLAVGASYEGSNATGVGGDENNDSAGSSGAVYVFVRSGSSWAQQAYIKASNTDASDNFGWAVALSSDGNTLAVGARGEGSNATGTSGSGQSNNDAVNAGAVYVFTRSGSAWAQQAYLKASNTDPYDYFGSAVTLSSDGNTLAVGARGEASNATGTSGSGQGNNDASGAGAVYVFTRSGSAWAQQAYLKASNSGAGDAFGYTVALSSDGNTLAVGALYEGSNATGTSGSGQSNNDAPNAGAVYVFTRSGSAWAQQAYLKASNTQASDFFGYSVALSDDSNTLAVGAYGEDSNATGTSGSGQSNNDASGAGAVYVFTRSGSVWAQQAYLKASNTDANDNFGSSVTLSSDGNTLAVGAPFEDSNAMGPIGTDQSDNSVSARGAVYVFTRSDSSWTQSAYLKTTHGQFSDFLGSSVSLSGAGNALAAGAYEDRSNATGVNGTPTAFSSSDSGAVYLYR